MMKELREQCPWDREQTFATLRALTIEEVYELTEAIDSGDMEDIREELGDVLLHVVFYSRMAAEQGAFEFADVVDGLCEKLRYRHPHIYGDVDAATTEEVKRNWEALKLKKRARKSGLLGGVPRGLPAIMKAERMVAKVGSVGFKAQDFLNAESEDFGDVLFAMIAQAKERGIDAEAALDSANRRFMAQFEDLEHAAESFGRSVVELTDAEREQLLAESRK